MVYMAIYTVTFGAGRGAGYCYCILLNAKMDVTTPRLYIAEH